MFTVFSLPGVGAESSESDPHEAGSGGPGWSVGPVTTPTRQEADNKPTCSRNMDTCAAPGARYHRLLIPSETKRVTSFRRGEVRVVFVVSVGTNTNSLLNTGTKAQQRHHRAVVAKAEAELSNCQYQRSTSDSFVFGPSRFRRGRLAPPERGRSHRPTRSPEIRRQPAEGRFHPPHRQQGHVLRTVLLRVRRPERR